MQQALHIFKKDARYLRFEIVMTLLIAAAFIFAEIRPTRVAPFPLFEPGLEGARFLLPLAWLTLIARVIHSEALPGDRGFWFTRPYAWRSLLGAKALFILVFVNLPIVVAQAVIIRAYGFSLWDQLPALLWSQALLTAVFVLPLAALSAVTAGLVQVLGTILTLAAATVAWIAAPVRSSAPWALDWIKPSYALVVITLAALAILTWQYARRRTAASRSLVAAAWVLVMAGYTFIPWSAAFAIQSRLSNQQVDQASVRVGFDPGRRWLARAVSGRGDLVRIDIPLEVTGIPEGMEVTSDGIGVTIKAPDGALWESERPLAGYPEPEAPRAIVAGSFYRNVKNEPVLLRGSLYLTLYGNRRARSLSLQGQPVFVPGAGMCSAGLVDPPRDVVICRYPFRSPPSLVSVYFGSQPVALPAFPHAVSYSPFPAELSISPIDQKTAASTSPGTLSPVSVVTMEALAHIRRDFEIGDLRLGDFEGPPTNRP